MRYKATLKHRSKLTGRKIGCEVREIRFSGGRFTLKTWWLPPKDRRTRQSLPQYRIRNKLLLVHQWGGDDFRTLQWYILGHEYRLTLQWLT